MKQFEYYSFSLIYSFTYMHELTELGQQGWQLVDRIHNDLIMMREVESKHEVVNATCEQVLNEVREILKTKENFSVVQRAKEVMALINNNEENNDKLNQYVAIEGETDSGEFRNLGLHHGLNTQTKK